MKLLIQEAAIVFVFGFGVIFWLISTVEVIRDETRMYEQQHDYGAGYVSGELYYNPGQEAEPGRENPHVPR